MPRSFLALVFAAFPSTYISYSIFLGSWIFPLSCYLVKIESFYLQRAEDREIGFGSQVANFPV